MIFDIGDVLTITTGRLLSLDGMGGVYRILNYLTRDNLSTHQLSRAINECRPWLLSWYPHLNAPEVHAALIRLDAALAAGGRDEARRIIADWLDDLARDQGRMYKLEPIPVDDHEVFDPVEEAKRMAPGRVKVIRRVRECTP